MWCVDQKEIPAVYGTTMKKFSEIYSKFTGGEIQVTMDIRNEYPHFV